MIIPALLLAAAAAQTPISADRIKADVKMLSSDAFEGRGPGEAGEAKAIAYIAGQFKAAGLKPGGDRGGWYQDVPLVRMDRGPEPVMAIRFSGDDIHVLRVGQDVTLGLRNEGRTHLEDAPLVFAGYGIVANGWNAYEGLDMRGKVAVVLANDPDFEAGRDLGFEGRRMAYPGRFGAKVEAAAKAGAAGLLVIHEDAAASYPFLQVSSGDTLPAMTIAPLTPSPFKFSGWLRRDQAVELLRSRGFELETLKARARDKGFRAFALDGAAVTLTGTLKATPITSHNVVGVLPGTSRASEYVVYGAHWDANGRNGTVNGDPIRNGAIDNATGTAELIEVARAFAAGKRPERTVVFIGWTAEEKGLLGAEYYASHPIYPLARTAAMINLDPHVVLPAARNLELVGGGRVSLEGDLRRIAAARGLRIDDEPAVEAGWYFRSDQFAFAKKGVPAITFRAGRDLVDGGLAKGNAIVGAYNAERYHQPSDQFMPDWTFAGTAQEATAAYELGRLVADSGSWPLWNAGNEYGAVRAATEAERGR